MNQGRRLSLVEAIVSTAIGFAISYTIWPAVQVFVLHQPVHMGQGAAVVGVYTAVSIVRGYIVRRAFNQWQHKPCVVCGRRAVVNVNAPYGQLWLCAYHGRAQCRRT